MRYSSIGLSVLCTLGCLACGDDEGALNVPDASGISGASSTGQQDAALDAGVAPTHANAADAAVPDSSPLDSTAPRDGGMDSSVSTPETGPRVERGALIDVFIQSQVGVVLDEIPEIHRAQLLDYLEQQADDFWVQRAKAQVALMGYRLVFRNFFYDEEEGRMQLPLPPPELWEISLTTAPRLLSLDGHAVLGVDFELFTTLLTTSESPGEAEPKLAYAGGVWEEPFVLPVDPELLLQRTGYACMDESEFPPNSVDGENVYTFYDHECEAAIEEDETFNSDCHITEHPEESCIEALERAVGKVEPLVRFTRVEWSEDVANAVRLGEVTNRDGADLDVVGEGLDNHRIVYRYISEDSCAVAEGCVSGTGWRRLLQFDASVHNKGAKALDIGAVDYYLQNAATPLGAHNIFQYSECHEHYHFSHYGDFVLESGEGVVGNKQAFCLQSTSRYSNNESSPLTHPYGACDYQGMQAGWGDDYGAGIECQWIDITDVPAETVALSFAANPDGFLCEGLPILDEEDHLTFERTEFTTPDGEPVDRPACKFAPDWDANNSDERTVTVPASGGLINTPCTRGQVGPLRDCDFTQAQSPQDVFTCEPGTSLSLECTVADGGAPVVVRTCDFSHVLGQGVACVFREALSNSIVTAGTHEVEVTCPNALDDDEPGGKFSLYVAPLLPGEAAVVNCQVRQ